MPQQPRPSGDDAHRDRRPFDWEIDASELIGSNPAAPENNPTTSWLAPLAVVVAALLFILAIAITLTAPTDGVDDEGSLPGCPANLVDMVPGRGYRCWDPKIGQYVGWKLGWRR